jgi:thiosulfate/3-mercaptopyruvate sulfurtransferase
MLALLSAIRAAVVAALAWATFVAQAASVILDTPQVVQAIGRDAIVWDVRAAAVYRQGHIPGAVNLGDVGKVLRDENSEDYLPQATIESLLGNAGIDPAREVIVYGAKASPYVYFALVTLQYFGGSSARVYHGGIEDWKAAGQPLSTDEHRLAPVKLHLTPQPEMLVDTEQVLRMVKEGKTQIIDARTPAEFNGEDLRALYGGHMPGAVSVHYKDNWMDPELREELARKETTSIAGMDLKPREQLQAMYSKFDPSKETVVYCQSGVRAAETATILKEIGFRNVKVYDSSWIGYGNRPDTPIEGRTVFNIGLVKERMEAMTARLDALADELGKMKAGK